jgi:hypothetical protein
MLIMRSNAVRTDLAVVPQYRDASKRRSSGSCSSIDYFVTEWEPMMTKHSEDEIRRWHADLTVAMIDAGNQNTWRLAVHVFALLVLLIGSVMANVVFLFFM